MARKKNNNIKKVLKEEKSLLKSLNSKIGKLASSMERARIDEYTSMLRRPWRFFWFNFVVGIFRGFGMALGFTVVFAIIIFVISKILMGMVGLPIVGQYIAELIDFVNQYRQAIPGR
jgi:hypothetical protein